MATDYQPRGRNGHTSHFIEGNLYMWGGNQRDLPRVHDSEEKERFISCLEVLDLSRGKWWQEPTIGQPPLAVYFYSSAVIGNDIYYYGGYCDHGAGVGCFHNSLYRLNVVSKEWSEVSPTTTDNGPMKKRGCGMAAIRIDNQDLLIVIGGWGPTNNNTPHQHNALYEEYDNFYVYTNEIHYYDLSSFSDKWISIKSTGQCPPPCHDFTITSVNDNTIILFGGVTPNGKTNDIFIGTCSSSTIKWEKISPSNDRSVKWPEGRWNHATTLLDEHHLLVVGGTSDSWIFDITRRTWEELTLPQSVTDRWDHSLSVMNINSASIAWVIVFGGYPYISDTSVIELRRSDGGEWSVEGVMTRPLKLNKILPSHKKQTQSKFQHEKDRLQQEIKNQSQQLVSGNVSELQKQVHEKDSHIARLYIKQREKGNTTGGNGEQPQQEKVQLQQEKDQHQQEKDQLQQEKDQLQHEKDQLQKEKDQLQQEKDQLQHEKDQLSGNVSELQKQVNKKDSHIARLKQRELVKNANDERSSEDSPSTLHKITTLLSHEIMKKSQLIKDSMADAIIVIMIFIIAYQLFGGIMASVTVTAVIVLGYLFITKLQIAYFILMLILIAFQAGVLLSVPVAVPSNGFNMTYSLIGGRPDTINWLDKGFKMDVHPGNFPLDVPVNVTVSLLQPPYPHPFNDYPRVTQVYVITSTHQPSGEVLIHLKHNAIINNDTDMTMFFILHQQNFNKPEFLKIRNLSDHFMTFGISHFSSFTGSGDGTTRTFYAMFYAKIHSGVVEIILNISQTEEMNHTSYSLNDPDSPIKIYVTEKTTITLEPSGCWKQGNSTLTKELYKTNPDREYYYYPEWTCWDSLWPKSHTQITVHFNTGSENVTNEDRRIFINPDINYPSIRWFKDHILEIFVTFVLIILFLIIICCKKKLEWKCVMISGLVLTFILLYIWDVDMENLLKFADKFVKILTTFFKFFTELLNFFRSLRTADTNTPT